MMTMRRFDYDNNDDEYREDVDKFFNEEDEDDNEHARYEELVEEELALQEAQLDVAFRELNHRTLRASIRICEKSFWWSFYSVKTRMKMINEAYSRLKKMEE
jgi:predicted metal-dependent hydrolase